jgi:hypothetical protein
VETEAESAEEPEEVPEAVAAEEEEDDDEKLSFANWNVPSWQELIASLYRPDR